MEGQIWFLPRSLQLSSFQAYKLRVTHLYQLKQHSILVSVGEDEEGINPLVRHKERKNAFVLCVFLKPAAIIVVDLSRLKQLAPSGCCYIWRQVLAS